MLGELLQPIEQGPEVPPARLDEARHPLQLRDPDRRLEVGRLQVEADVRVRVLVVVAARQLAAQPKRLPQVLLSPGAHQQSRPQSRTERTIRS